MSNEPNEQMLTKEEQFQAVAQILAVGLRRLINDRLEREARSTSNKDQPPPGESPSDSEEPPAAKGCTRTQHPPIDVQIDTKAREICRQCRLPNTDLDDLRQSIHVDLLKRQHLYDPKRASREWFAKVVIKSWAAMYLRDRNRQKRVIDKHMRPLDECEDLAIRDPIVDPQDQVARTDAILHALTSLPDHLLHVVKIVVAKGRAAGARELAVSRRQISNRMAEVRRYFESAGLGKCDLV